jgi:hypothetical protein
LLTSAESSSSTWRRLAFLLYSLPFLLIVAALVPLNFSFVPYRVTDTWQHLRVELALFGGAVLLVEAIMYVLFH